MSKWNRDYWIALIERVIATFLQTLLAVLVVDGFDFISASWKDIFIASAFAAGIALIKGLLANMATNNGPGLTDSEQVVPLHARDDLRDVEIAG